MMTGPPDDVYDAAAQAYDKAGSWTDPIFALRAAADSAYAAGVAAGRAQAAADIRAALMTEARTLDNGGNWALATAHRHAAEIALVVGEPRG